MNAAEQTAKWQEIGRILTDKLNEAGLSRYRLAANTGVNYPSICKIINGYPNKHAQTIIKFFELDLTVPAGSGQGIHNALPRLTAEQSAILKCELILKGITQTSIAVDLGFPRQTVGFFVNGAVGTLFVREQIKKIIGMDPMDIKAPESIIELLKD